MKIDFEKQFFKIITKGRKDNTYKFALARFLLDYSSKLEIGYIKNRVKSNQYEIIPYTKIAKSFLRYYWHQECKYKIRQNPFPSKPPNVVKTIRQIFGKKYIPKSFTDMPKDKISKAEDQIIENVFGKIKHKKSHVVPKFQNVLEGGKAKHVRVFYDYDESSIQVYPEAIKFFHEKYALLYKLVMFEWSKFLEKYNSTPRLISKIESDEVRRHELRKYLKIYKKFKTCFYCDNTLDKDHIHVDHFIPWSYIFEDKAWNLVLACNKCNLKKHDSLAKGFLDKLILRNKENFMNITELKKSIEELDVTNWKKEIRRNFRNCEDYGFEIIKLP